MTPVLSVCQIGSEIGHRRDDRVADDLQRLDSLHAHHLAEDRLDPQARQPAELGDQLADLLAARPDVEAEGAVFSIAS